MSLMQIIEMIMVKGPAILSAVIALLSAAIGVCLLIPGDQPEKALQAVVDFLTKLSRK